MLPSIRKIFVIVCFSIGLNAIIYAVPMQISYQGYLTDENNTPINKTLNKITFRLYHQPENGMDFWSQIHKNIVVNDGVYNVILADFTTDTLDNDIYLGVSIEDDSELKPRQKITSVVFAIKANEAETVSDGAITKNKLAPGAVTSDKIADNAVTSEKIDHGPGSGLNADLLDGIDSQQFALKNDCIQKGQDHIQLKEIKPDAIPITTTSGSGELFAKSAGVDFYSDHSLVQGLVLYWKIDEQQSEVINDYVSSSDGICVNFPVIVSGKTGNARYFNGNKGQYIINNQDNPIDFGSQNFSISFWIKAEKPTNWTIIMGKANDWGNDNDYGWLFGNAGGQDGSDLTFVINPGDAGNNKSTKSVTAANVFDNQWHHVVGIRNNTQIHLYVDNQLKNSETGVFQTVSVNSPFVIGSGIGDYIFSGIIDELAMWSRALTTNEISYLYNDGNANDLPLVDSGLFYKNENGQNFALLDAWQAKEKDISFSRGKVGIGTDQPQTALDVNGGVRVGRFTVSTRPVCTETISGTFIFDTEHKKPFVCDGSLWKPLDSDFDEDGIVDWNDKDDTNPQIKHEHLTTENIKNGTEIFGVTGSYTSDATAVASDVKAGKSFYSKGQKIVGNMNVYTGDQPAALVSNSGGRLDFRVPTGCFNGSFDVYGVDGDFVGENIKNGVEIFGLNGSFSGSMPVKGEINIPISGIQFFQYGSSNSRSCYWNNGTLDDIHCINNTYYFLSLLDYDWNCSKDDQAWWLKALVGKYIVSNNSQFIETKNIYFYESSKYHFGNSAKFSEKYLKVCDGHIYFIKSLSDWDTDELTYYWQCFNIYNNSFSGGSSTSLPCDNNPNNNELLIDGKNWKHKTSFLYTGKSGPATYIYEMWLTTSF